EPVFNAPGGVGGFWAPTRGPSPRRGGARPASLENAGRRMTLVLGPTPPRRFAAARGSSPTGWRWPPGLVGPAPGAANPTGRCGTCRFDGNGPIPRLPGPASAWSRLDG